MTPDDLKVLRERIRATINLATIDAQWCRRRQVREADCAIELRVATDADEDLETLRWAVLQHLDAMVADCLSGRVNEHLRRSMWYALERRGWIPEETKPNEPKSEETGA